MSKMNQALENVNAPDVPTEQPAKENKLGYRLLALLLLAFSVLAVVLIPYGVLNADSAPLYKVITGMIDGGAKFQGFLPVYDVSVGVARIAYNTSIYVLTISVAVAALVSLIALFAGKKGLVKASLFLLAIGSIVYAAGYYMCATSIDAKSAVELTSVIVAVVCALIYLALSVMKVGKAGWLHVLQFVLTLVYTALLLLTVSASKNFVFDFKVGLSTEGILLAIVVLVAGVNLVWSLVRVSMKKGIIGDVVRCVIALVAAVIVIFDTFSGKSNILFAIAVAVIAIVQLLIALVVLLKSRKKEEEPVAEEPEDDGFVVEEYAEAYPYEGGPVAGVLMAQEVNPSFLPHEPHVNTAGYDFYNSKSFDPFIAMLSTEERNQFTEIFILKFHGPMSELPEYEVGGDNKEFFRKIFIYLGQYRDRIPSGLLGKMYQYSLKI